MEATAKVQFQVGVFLIVGVVMIMVSIWMIGGEAPLFSKQAHLHAQFDEVQGLVEGSVVSLAGVNVGNIEKIDFLTELNKLDVVMRVDQKFVQRIRQGTQVEIRTQGALGDKYLFLVPGDSKSDSVKDGDTLPVAQASDIFSVVSNHGKDTEHVFDIINEIYRMTKTINNEGRLEKMMANLSAASGNLKEFSTEAKRLTDGMGAESGVRIRQSLDHLESVMSKIDRGEGTLGALVNDPTVHEQLKNMLGGSNRSQTIKSLFRTSIEKSQPSGR